MKLLLVTLLVFVAFLSYAECIRNNDQIENGNAADDKAVEILNRIGSRREKHDNEINESNARRHIGTRTFSCTPCMFKSDCIRLGPKEICFDNCCTPFRRKNIKRKRRTEENRGSETTEENNCIPCIDEMNCPDTMVCVVGCCVPWLRV